VLQTLIDTTAASVIETTHWPGLFHQEHFLVHEQTSYTKHILMVLALITIYWMPLRVNGI